MKMNKKAKEINGIKKKATIRKRSALTLIGIKQAIFVPFFKGKG